MQDQLHNYCRDYHDYQTRANSKRPPNIHYFNINACRTCSTKYNCIKNLSNFRKTFLNIPLNHCDYQTVKEHFTRHTLSVLKTLLQNWTLLKLNIQVNAASFFIISFYYLIIFFLRLFLIYFFSFLCSNYFHYHLYLWKAKFDTTPKSLAFNPAPRPTLKEVLTYQRLKPTSHLSTNVLNEICHCYIKLIISMQYLIACNIG